MRNQDAPTQLHPTSTQAPIRPPLPLLAAATGAPYLLHLAFLCLAMLMAAAWYVEPFVVTAEFRLPPSAVALAVLLLAASFHAMIHLVHSFVAPCRLPASTAAAVAALRSEAASAIAVGAVAVGFGVASCLYGACGAPQEYRSAYS